jgi:SPX domain protein involved in polyphosphate accumulation
MKFGKNLIRVVELSDPEWGPYWINYKFMKKKINEIITNQGGRRMSDVGIACNLQEISKSAAEVEFFRSLKAELKKTSNFFSSAEELYRLRHLRVSNGFIMLQDKNILHDKNMWTRLLMACVKFYKDVLLLENFAIMNYCGFSKILKKHDKSTGFSTREAFMRNVMSQQNFTHYPYVLDLLKQSEKLFNDIQQMER